MPKAEVGSTKHLSNKMKSKGLQRLRWYCQICEKQCRDANGFKQHTMSESHVRQMLIVGEDPKKYINDFSNQFLKDFMQLLRTSHGEKQVQMNQFYQNYIANKEHIHMNATKWPSLTEFAKHLGREGICRVEETEKGIHIAWIDDSPDALRRKEAVRRKELQDKGDEEREQRMIREQIRRAQKETGAEDGDNTEMAEERELKRQEGEKVKLSFGAKQTPAAAEQRAPDGLMNQALTPPNPDGTATASSKPAATSTSSSSNPMVVPPPTPAPISMKMAAKPQPKNVFAAAKKNALGGGSKKVSVFEQPKKMSEAERIMKEEIERKRARESGGGFGANKRQRI
ncbi:domain of Kin17 curved DNA-binding protein-domain-containing protein [Xylariomycetidae sp. FL2044]|nr:domain of Kin17 curved DNA-binding protein-domain-containing protein [Xylariomycetidae sp. FL2044]